MKELKFFDKLYVGFQKDRYIRGENHRILGFATPYEDTAAGKKRRDSVDNWRDATLKSTTIENKSMSGFKIIDAVSRSSTDNKLFRIEDPRGFELEIDVYNLLDLIRKYTIVNGVIIEPLLWGREGQKNILISENSDEYRAYILSTKKFTLVPGMYLKNKSGTMIYRYEGKFAFHKIAYDVNRFDPLPSSLYSWDRNKDYAERRAANPFQTTVNIKIDRTPHSRPVEVYSVFMIDDSGQVLPHWKSKTKQHELHVRKSIIPNLISITVDDLGDGWIVEAQAPIGKFIDKNIDLITPGHSDRYMLFNTKEDAKDFVYTPSIQENIIKYYYEMFNSHNHYGIITCNVFDGEERINPTT